MDQPDCPETITIPAAAATTTPGMSFSWAIYPWIIPGKLCEIFAVSLETSGLQRLDRRALELCASRQRQMLVEQSKCLIANVWMEESWMFANFNASQRGDHRDCVGKGSRLHLGVALPCHTSKGMRGACFIRRKTTDKLQPKVMAAYLGASVISDQ